MWGKYSPKAVGAVAVIAVGGVLGAAAPAVGAPAQGVSVGVAKPPKPAGFVPVKTLSGKPLAMVSPAPGELWLLAQSPSGGAVLQHLKSGRWTSEALRGDTSHSVLAATARDDVWLSVAGTVRHYDGRAWTTVPLPRDPRGKQLVAHGPLATPERGTVHLSAAVPDEFGTWRILRLQRGRWTDLGMAQYQPGTSYAPQRIEATRTGVSVLAASPHLSTIFELKGSTWTKIGMVVTWAGPNSASIGGFFPDVAGRYLVLGGAGGDGFEPMCRTWSAPEVEAACTSTVVTGAAARLKNGSMVLGGNDYRLPRYPPRPDSERPIEGKFALRDRAGAERPLAGDPGTRTLLMAAENHQNSAWAATVEDRPTGPVYTLQRYDG